MKTIPLTRSLHATVDDEDYERLAKFKWHAYPGRHTYYAATAVTIGPSMQMRVTMHTMLLGHGIPRGTMVDHIDGDGLNNQRSNLRHASPAQNIRNQRIRDWPLKSSQYRGVTHCRHSNKTGKKLWIAQISVDGKMRRVGRFLTEIEAAAAYDVAAQRHFGQFARLNLTR